MSDPVIRSTITVRTQLVGFHFWPEPTPDRQYLGQRHRHVFHIDASTSVSHDDREIEFHDLKACVHQAVHRLASSGGGAYRDPATAPVYEFGSMSCEAIARHIAQYLSAIFERPFTVSVFEDNECGATVSTSTSTVRP